MDILTHLNMSLRFKRIIERNFPVKLNTLRFMLGSIKPDLSTSYQEIPHYKKEASKFIHNEIRSLLETKLYPYDKCTSHFSERLGVITHYLSDFFCYAHSDNFTDGYWRHFIYEAQLSCHYMIYSEKSLQFNDIAAIQIKPSMVSLFDYLDQLHLEYLNKAYQPNPGTDIAFTFSACLSLCFSIMDACLANQRELSPVEAEEALMA